MDKILNAIEAHPHTITIFIFICGIIIGWFSGLFKLVKHIAEKSDNRLRIRINTRTARCSIINEKSKNSKTRFVIILSVKVSNPSEKLISVSDFRLQYKIFGSYERMLAPLSFPNPPIVNLGMNDKVLPVFGGSFPAIDQALGRELCPDGNVLPGHTQDGYLMFIDESSLSSSELLSHMMNKGIVILLSCLDVRDKRYKTVGLAQYLEKKKLFELIPGIEHYIEGDRFLS